jgi:hypothetical protein
MNTVAHGRRAARARQAKKARSQLGERGQVASLNRSRKSASAQVGTPGVKRRTDSTKVAGSYASAAFVGVTLELRMVPGIEALCAELETAAARFADDEALEQR